MKLIAMYDLFLFSLCLCILNRISEAESNTTTTNNNTGIDLSKLGEPKWDRLRPGWALTVNDQCVYEFVFQFEHDETLPLGTQNFEGECVFKDPTTKKPLLADDDKPYLEPRQFWERFPDYVWATIGFQHLSIDWYPCGHRPRGYSKAHYGFSFFRVTPEFRVNTMTCDLHSDEEVIVPGEKVCAFRQTGINGMNFNIIPSAILNRNVVANMPETFYRPELGNGPVPHIGLRSWDQEAVPKTPTQWEDSPVFMSSYGGDIAMWHAKIPYSRISGPDNLFTAMNYRYFEPTISTLPDTHAFHYNADDGILRFSMVGIAGLCRDDFERAQAAAGGQPTFPNWDDFFRNAEDDGTANGDDSSTTSETDKDKDTKKSGSSTKFLLLLPTIGSMTLSLLLLLGRW